jgi:uncharacterized protein YndB with AHSA1/START domain
MARTSTYLNFMGKTEETFNFYQLTRARRTVPEGPMNYSRPEQTELTLRRAIAGSPAEVYDAWLSTKSPGGPWFGVKRVILDARIDGLFYHCVSFEGREWAHYGRFVELERPKRIVHTWVSEGTRGLESVVTLTFEGKDDQTLVTLCHAGVPDDDFGHQHGEGWAFVLGAIEERFAKRSH